MHPDLWDDRLKRIRALGLNAVTTYTAWNLHEPTQGNFDFTSPDLNISRFFTLAQQNGLNVILRPTPYIDAEFELGGHPYWLLKYEGIKMRTSDQNYTKAVASYYDKLLDVIAPFLYKNGGPILMLQVENEYGNIEACDKNYTYWLRDIIRNKLGNDVVLFTNNGLGGIGCGAINDTVTTLDFGPPGSNNDVDNIFKELDMRSNGAPRVCSEFYADWMLYWNQTKKELSGSNFQDPQHFAAILSHMSQVSNASISIYMVHGGMNIGFMNSALRTEPIITSYYVGSPIGDNGNITEMYKSIWAAIKNFTDWDTPPLAIPDNNPIAVYGQVTLNQIGLNLISTLTQIQEQCTHSTNPLSFEDLDHPYGYVLYTTTLKVRGSTLATPAIRDYGYVFLNNAYMGMITRDIKESLILYSAIPGDILRILVENRGRTCISVGLRYPIPDSKGLPKNITLDNQPITDWYQCGINLTKGAIDSLATSFLNDDKEVEHRSEKLTPGQTGVFVGSFDANVVEDTYLNTTGWGKGQLFVNGYNIGRYWPNVGPQYTLYIPKPYLQPKNTITLIELAGTNQNTVNFVDHPIFTFKD